MSFLDEANTSNDFPFPEGEQPLPESVPVKEKVSVKAPCRDWRLLDLRSNTGLGEAGDRAVVNVRARGLDTRYPHTGEVAYWFSPDQLDNEKHPARRKMAMLAKMAVDLGLSDADDWANPDGATMIRLIHQACQKNTPAADFKAQLIWEARGWQGKEGPMTSDEHEFRYIDKVTEVNEADDADDAPF